MKEIFIILTILLAHICAAVEVTPPNPFEAKGKLEAMPDSLVSKIDLNSHHNVNDAIKQIIAGLPREGRSSLVLDISEAELIKMPMKGDLHLRNTPLHVVLVYLGKLSPVGYRFWNNAWHISKERADDIITVDYRVSKALLEQLGLVIEPGLPLRTKMGQRMWPPASEWDASYTARNPEPKEKRDVVDVFGPSDMGVLRVRAARSYQEEISAILLLKKRGYDMLSLVRLP